MIPKQTNRPAIVFLLAGQSNAGGCGVLSPEIHEARGCHVSHPLVPGSTAKEVGLPTNADDYTHSYIWVPDQGFQAIDPNRNAKAEKTEIPGHGMELPVLHELEERFPENDLFVIKYGPGGTNLHEEWNPETQNCERPCYETWLEFYRQAMSQLTVDYPEVRVTGLYWDQGESDGIDEKQGEYAENLASFIATVRRDTNLPGLPFFIRKHIFNWGNIDIIIAAQEEVVAADPLCHMLCIDLGDRKKNYDAWAYSPNNGHVSSKGFVELTKRLFDGPLRGATAESFDVYATK